MDGGAHGTTTKGDGTGKQGGENQNENNPKSGAF
jgi:hypothetical protein